MYRFLVAGCLVSLVAASSGCMMCASPYDYCGPVVSEGCGPACTDPLYRAGSVLPPGPGPMGPNGLASDVGEPMPGEEWVVDESGLPPNFSEHELVEGEVVYDGEVAYEDDVVLEEAQVVQNEAPVERRVARPPRRMVRAPVRPRYQPMRPAHYVR